jgi:polysaccharide export outer membrane protein
MSEAGKRRVRPGRAISWALAALVVAAAAAWGARAAPQGTPAAGDRPAIQAAGRLCQAVEPIGTPGPGPACDCVPGVDCGPGCNNDCLSWQHLGPVGFDQFGHGEYVGRPRAGHVPEYRLRVDDELEFVYRVTRDETTKPYEINVGDELRVESFTDANIDRTLVVQPDGTITLRLLGQVRATRHTVAQLRDELEERYKKYYKVPAITVTPIKVNTKLEDLRATVDSRAGSGGQFRRARVTPEGSVALPAIGSVPVQGLTLAEVQTEINARYSGQVEGIEVTPVLALRAPRHVFVLGEVRSPGRYTLDGPTTVMQALALAGSWNVGANVEQVVVFRRGEDWRLLATVLNLRPALLGKSPCPAGEIWVSDSDLVIVPKSKILLFDHFVELVFTKGVYGVLPFSTSVTYTNLTSF